MVEIQELQAQGLGQEAPWTSLWGDDTAELLLSPKSTGCSSFGGQIMPSATASYPNT